MPLVYRTCRICLQAKPLTSYYRNSTARGFMRRCKKCHNVQTSSRLSDPRKRMWHSSYANARVKGIPHTITPADIPLPRTCKYLGIALDYRRADERGRLRSFDAPSIDRIDPSLGYVPGNIQVISDLANRMKQDATVPQLLAFAEGVLRVHGA